MDMDEIRDEILRFSPLLEKIRPGDITLKMIQDTKKCSYDSARRIAKVMEDSGEYYRLSVMKPNGRPAVVLRKVNDGTNK